LEFYSRNAARTAGIICCAAYANYRILIAAYLKDKRLRKVFLMDVSKIVAEIDTKIASLQHARAVLLGLDGDVMNDKPRRGRPKGSTNAAKAGSAVKPVQSKRNLSPEGRKRIAEAMKRRWAERRKEAPKKVAVKKEPAVKK
jgi:hypothetical protein